MFLKTDYNCNKAVLQIMWQTLLGCNKAEYSSIQDSDYLSDILSQQESVFLSVLLQKCIV